MVDFPTGTVSFLFTDIEGSTSLLERLGDDYPPLLDRHHELLLYAIEEAGGVRVSTAGDGVFAVFEHPSEAVGAAVAAQQALDGEVWPLKLDLRVRMGIHTGTGAVGPDGYVGIDVHRAARIGDAANGGQIVVSESTRSLVESALPDTLVLEDLGAHRLKDLVDEVHLYQLAVPGITPDRRPLRSLSAVRNNLPEQLTSFVGREAELAKLDRLIEDNRVVTVTGVGGTGKSRLVYEYAGDVLHRFTDGVWVAELAPVVDPADVPGALASAMAIRPQPDVAVEETLASAIGQKTVLLILDNCEHLLNASANLALRLVEGGPNIRMLTTSREALGIPGEAILSATTLGLPPPGETTTANALTYSSVELFVKRACLVDSEFELSEENVASVAHVCRRLDGVPLAIELAAARCRSLNPREIADRLDDRFRLLTGGKRTSLPRQQTLEATVSWSYEQLSESEQIVFSRLSVFSGGFFLRSAVNVCEGEGLDAFEVEDLLLALVDKSMIAVARDPLGTRYRLLETLRQFAKERLEETGDSDRVRAAHAEESAQVANQLKIDLRGPEQVAALDRYETEHDNFRSGLAWAEGVSDPTLFLRLLAGVGPFWNDTGQWVEGRKWLAETDFRNDAIPHHLKAEVILDSLDFIVSEDKAKGVELTEVALEAAMEIGEESLIGRAKAARGYAIVWTGQRDEALQLLEEAVAQCRKGDDPWVLAEALEKLGNVRTRDTDTDELDPADVESLEIFRRIGDRIKVGEALYNLGSVTRLRLDERTVEFLEESLDILSEIGSLSGKGHALLSLGGYQRSTGDPKASETLAEGVQILEDAGDRNCYARAELEVALLIVDDDQQQAENTLQSALRISSEVSDWGYEALELEALAKIAVRRGQSTRAVALYGAAASLMTAASRPPTPSSKADREPEFSIAKKELPADAYREAWDRGAAMTEEEAVKYALRYDPDGRT